MQYIFNHTYVMHMFFQIGAYHSSFAYNFHILHFMLHAKSTYFIYYCNDICTLFWIFNAVFFFIYCIVCNIHIVQTISFIEISIEAGILLGGKHKASRSMLHAEGGRN
jgi:hypothetical protein